MVHKYIKTSKILEVTDETNLTVYLTDAPSFFFFKKTVFPVNKFKDLFIRNSLPQKMVLISYFG